MTGRRRPDEVWLVLTGRFSARLFVDTGILDGLRGALGDRLVPVVACAPERVEHWSERLGDRMLHRSELEVETTRLDRMAARWDALLDRQIGAVPLAVRFNRRHGLFVERMEAGHEIGYLDPARMGSLPEWGIVERVARGWTASPRRHVASVLRRCFRDRCGHLVLSTVQGDRVRPYLTAARRYDRPVAGYVASWDHTVGKGVITPYLDRYVVQNATMRDDLVRYHRLSASRVTVAGWPLSDAFARPTPVEAYDALLHRYGLDTARPVVLYAGNTASNMPTDGAIAQRLVEWATRERVGVVVRPHPNDAWWRERFAACLDREGVFVQQPSYADYDVLVTLLHHVDCVVTNAGTILLDALANDRPAICVLYDEGAPGERRAELNVTGRHYRPLVESGAFVQARSFEAVTAGIRDALEAPGERAEERARVVREVLGEVDGRAAKRVVNAILDVVAAPAAGGR